MKKLNPTTEINVYANWNFGQHFILEIEEKDGGGALLWSDPGYSGDNSYQYFSDKTDAYLAAGIDWTKGHYARDKGIWVLHRKVLDEAKGIKCDYNINV